MNIRTKALGILAALMMTMSLSAGAMAQTTDTENVSVSLENQVCGIDIGVTGGSFGTWTWNSAAYEKPADSTVSLTADFLRAPFGGCTVTVTFAGLGSAPPAIDIGPGNFSAAIGTTPIGDPSNWAETSATSTDFAFSYTLDSVPDTLSPGNYSGEIVANVANAA